MRDSIAAAPDIDKSVMRLRQRLAGERQRRAIKFQIEARQLRHHQRIVERRQQLRINRGREVIVIDDPGLDLEPDHMIRLRKTVRLKKTAHMRGLMRQTPGELRPVFAGEPCRADFLAHEPLIPDRTPVLYGAVRAASRGQDAAQDARRPITIRACRALRRRNRGSAAPHRRLGTCRAAGHRRCRNKRRDAGRSGDHIPGGHTASCRACNR